MIFVIQTEQIDSSLHKIHSLGKSLIPTMTVWQKKADFVGSMNRRRIFKNVVCLPSQIYSN